MSSLYLGLMSGTSMDGIDAVVVEISSGGTCHVLASHNETFEPELQQQLLHAVSSKQIALHHLAQLDVRVARHFAKAANHVLQHHQIARQQIVAIGSHGQTLLHGADQSPAYSMQIGDPNIIAEETGITTIADFRRRDIAVGGQGAPLVPCFHQSWLEKIEGVDAVLNLGGIANITLLGGAGEDPQLGFDTGPANTLIDAWVRHRLGKTYDQDGAWARQGQVHQQLLALLLQHPFFTASPPKSADINQFNLAWLEIALSSFKEISDIDVAATLVELSAVTVCQAVKQYAGHCKKLIACGGGCHNHFLIQRIQAGLGAIQLELSEDYGIGVDWVEATAFAWLAFRHINKQSGNAESITGAKQKRILGACYPA